MPSPDIAAIAENHQSVMLTYLQTSSKSRFTEFTMTTSTETITASQKSHVMALRSPCQAENQGSTQVRFNSQDVADLGECLNNFKNFNFPCDPSRPMTSLAFLPNVIQTISALQTRLISSKPETYKEDSRGVHDSGLIKDDEIRDFLESISGKYTTLATAARNPREILWKSMGFAIDGLKSARNNITKILDLDILLRESSETFRQSEVNGYNASEELQGACKNIQRHFKSMLGGYRYDKTRMGRMVKEDIDRLESSLAIVRGAYYAVFQAEKDRELEIEHYERKVRADSRSALIALTAMGISSDCLSLGEGGGIEAQYALPSKWYSPGSTDEARGPGVDTIE